MIHTKLKFVAVILFSLTAVAVAFPQEDKAGFKDTTLFTRMPNFWGDWVEDKQFDSYEFPLTRDKNERIEGHFSKYLYRFDESRGQTPSSLQVMRNYQNAAKRIGGKVLFENDERTTLQVTKDGKETWVSVEPYGAQMTLVIVERQAMQQDVAANAAALQGGLAQVGHVEVPGIFFDFSKSEVKSESKPALDEVAKLLKASPNMRVWVVGHTDSVGLLDTNQKLSEARASAVVRALVTNYAISPTRLKGCGVGPLSPIASNDSEDGRAKNRRVELVKQ